MEIDTAKIQSELQELAGEGIKVKVKLNRRQLIACSSRETDRGISISFNPKRIRTPKKFEEHLDDLRRNVTWKL